MTADQNITDHLKRLEEKLLRFEVRNSAEEISQLLSVDFLEIGDSGRVYNKAQVISALQEEPSSKISIEDFAASKLADGLFLVRYISIKETEKNQKISSLRSSIWKFIEDRWCILFHQGTPLKN